MSLHPHRQRAELHPRSLVDRVELQLVVAQVDLLQLGQAGQGPVGHGAQLVVLDPEHLQAARQAQWHRLERVARQVQRLQHPQLAEGVPVQLAVGQPVVTEVELDERVEKNQVVAADLGDGVVQDHEGLGAPREAPGNALQQVVVHVQGVQLLQTLERISNERVVSYAVRTSLFLCNAWKVGAMLKDNSHIRTMNSRQLPSSKNF